MIHPSKILAELGIPARKSFGQNFLVNTHSLQGTAEHLPGKHLIEIGPGLGSVTGYFLDLGYTITAVEKDRALAAHLEEKFRDRALHVICADFLEVDADLLKKAGAVSIIGNLPFYITTAILERVFLELDFLRAGLFGLQKEVARRICAGRGSSFALLTALLGEARWHGEISRNSFYPVPNVDAGWVLWRRGTPPADIPGMELLLRGIFWGKRKQMGSSLRRNPHFPESERGRIWLRRMDSDPGLLKDWAAKRAEELSPEDLISLLTLLDQAE